jgi:hypothetical protein
MIEPKLNMTPRWAAATVRQPGQRRDDSLFADVSSGCTPFASSAVRFLGKWVDPGGIDPAVVEVEEGADGDGVPDLFVVPTLLVERDHVGGTNVGRIVIDLVDEAEHGFLAVVEGRGIEVSEDGFDEGVIVVEFRRDRGVRLRSKRAVVALGGIGGDELAEGRSERGRFAEDLLGEAGEMLGGGGLEGEQVPDLRVLLAGLLHGIDGFGVGGGLVGALETREEHGLHREGDLTRRGGAGAIVESD